MGDPTPHDHLFRYVFSDPEQAASYLKDVLPAQLSSRIDWDQMTALQGSFVDEGLRAQHTDLVFSVQIHEEDRLAEGFVYILFEHQSTDDSWMAWRLLRYIVRIWEQHRRENPSAVWLPIVIPVVLFQGGSRWGAARELHGLIDWPLGTDPYTRRLVPQLHYQLQDLSGIPDDELTGRALVQLTLRLLKYARRGDLVMRLPGWKDIVSKVLQSPSGLSAIEAVIRYIFEVDVAVKDDMSIDTWEKNFKAVLRQHFDQQTLEGFMSRAQQYIEKGRQLGREEGREQGLERGRLEARLDMLQRLLVHRFGPLPAAAQRQLESADAETLLLWSERAFQESTLDAVLQQP